MRFQLLFTEEARQQLLALKKTSPGKHRKVIRALGRLERDPRHPGLHTHEFESLTSLLGVKVWEAYVESKTPGAYRIFWYYGRDRGQIVIYAITPHP